MDFRKSKCIWLTFVLLGIAGTASAQNFSTKTAKVSLYSSTPVEDIRAVSNAGQSVIVAATKQVAFQVAITSFEFEKKLMQEHFNEDYMESGKYPQAKFKGTIQENIDLKKDGEYNVTVKGLLNVHGVEKPRTIPGKITVKNGALQVQSSFDVACADHAIKIPTLVFNKIAEVIKITISATYNASK